MKWRAIEAFTRNLWDNWKSRDDFVTAQKQVAGILALAWVGNNWPASYPRDENENATMFWVMNVAILVAALVTIQHDANGSTRGVQLLSRDQTEEWKGWMQWAFIMYHYFRARFVYNEIRIFVSSYVFLTGWGNWQYFEKKKDFSLERAISMWLRINYFPLLLCLVVGTKLDDFYIVPLHTTGFFITMATAYVAHVLERFIKPVAQRNLTAIAMSLLAHVLFYETPAVNFLKIFSDEIFFRFQADKYSTWFGILAGFCWPYLKKAMQFYNTGPPATFHQNNVSVAQGAAGLVLILFWYYLFGSNPDKFTYNLMHPYIFWIPVFGYLMMSNASKYSTEVHSHALEFFGRITLETYVLQFHLFMCQNVKHIPIVVPGSGGPNGHILLKILNMLITGAVFVAAAFYARKNTVATQDSVTDLMNLVRQFYRTGSWPNAEENEAGEIDIPLVKTHESGGNEGKNDDV